MEVREHADNRAAKVFEGMGIYAPTLGIIGAVLGLMAVMQNLADPSKLGTGIAAAFTATVYGIGLANLFFLPIAGKLKGIVAEQTQVREMVIEGVVSILLGENPRAIERGVGLNRLVAPTTPAGLPSALLRRRPDLAQAERQLAATDRSLDAARGAFLPAVQLTVTGGVVDSSLLAERIDVFSLGGSVLTPLFDAGRLRAQADAAAARRDQAAFAYRRAALNAFREVEDALATVRQTDEQARALERQHSAVAQALALARNRYQAGYSPYLDQLEAQRGLLAVELQQVQARSDRLNASVALFQALGGGWALSPSP